MRFGSDSVVDFRGPLGAKLAPGPRLAQLPNQPREAPTSFLRPHQEKKKGTWQKPS